MIAWPKILGKQNKKWTEEVRMIPIAQIDPSPFQPREPIDAETIQELSWSMNTHGVIQPIVVRPRGERYELVAGERRWRAAEQLGWESIASIVRDMTDAQSAVMALIENLQRENLSPLEEARAYANLIELYKLTQESLAQRIGKTQSSVANKIRLLQLGEEAKKALNEKRITERHARVLLSVPQEEDQAQLVNEIIAHHLNVKQTEQRVQQFIQQQLQNDSEQGEQEQQPTEKGTVRKWAYPKNMKLAINTVKQSIKLVQQSGMNIEAVEQDYEDHYEIIIRIEKINGEPSPT